MKRVLCTGILAASVVAGYVYWHANRSVYSQHVYSGGYTFGPQWHFGTSPHWIGFTEYTDVGFPNEWSTKRETPTYTDIDLASHKITIKAEAWKVGLAAVSILALICWLMTSAWMFFTKPPRANVSEPAAP